jgi:hypothetical protein
MSDPEVAESFAHLRRQASARADRTVARVRAGITTLQASRQKITAESIKQVTHDLEPGFSGVSFQVIRRNARAYTLYREAADAFKTESTSTSNRRHRRGRRRGVGPPGRTPRAKYDPLQRLDKRDLVRRIRALEDEVHIEHGKRAALAYDQQVLQARLLRLETEIILLQAEHQDRL